MDENEEDIEENDSDSDGEVMNMANDLMCSTPPGAEGGEGLGRGHVIGGGNVIGGGAIGGCCGRKGRGRCGGRGHDQRRLCMHVT